MLVFLAHSHPFLHSQDQPEKSIVIHMQKPVLFPQSENQQRMLEELLSDLPRALAAEYELDSGFSSGGAGGSGGSALYIETPGDDTNITGREYRMTIRRIISDGTSIITMELLGVDESAGSGNAPAPFTLFRNIEDLDLRMLSQMLMYQLFQYESPHAVLYQTNENPPPLVLDYWSTEYISFRDIESSLTLLPFSVETRSSGASIIAAGSLALEFDQEFRLKRVIGKDFVRQGRYSDFYDIELSASEILYSRPAAGSYINRFHPMTGTAGRIYTPVQIPLSFEVLNEGELVVSDSANPDVFRVSEGESRRTAFHTNSYTAPSVLTVSMDGSLWAYDIISGIISIFSPSGNFISSRIPLLPPDQRGRVKSLESLNDGSYLILTDSHLYRFGSNGIPVWSMEGIPGVENSNFMYALDMAYNHPRGEIIIPLSSTSMVLRLLDQADNPRLDSEPTVSTEPDRRRELADLQAERFARPGDVRLLRAIAEIHLENSARMPAEFYLRRALELSPDNIDLQTRLARLKGEILTEQTLLLAEETRQLLINRGPETARPNYQRTIAAFEELLYMNPRDGEIAEEKRSLEQEFRSYTDSAEIPPGPIEFRNPVFPAIFPSLTGYYAVRGWGSMELYNPSPAELSGIVISLHMPEYLSFPLELRLVEPLQPGESREIRFLPVFTSTLMELREAVAIQLSVQAEYNLGGERRRRTAGYAADILGSRSLVWDDSAKLASFIQPSEPNVEEFAFTLLKESSHGPGLSSLESSFNSITLRAWRILEGLGRYGIEYVEDPVNPISGILGDSDIVDTVRYPGTTLLYKSGDCDDSSALCASLLESAGVETAIMTVPGHVFIAFNSGEPGVNRWLFEMAGLKAIEHNNSLWIPVETTMLNRGFLPAWKAGGDHLTRYGYPDGNRASHSAEPITEFIPLSRARALYPPAAVSGQSYGILGPGSDSLIQALNNSRSFFARTHIDSVIESGLSRLSSFTGRRLLREKTVLGGFIARFGELEEAERMLEPLVSQGGGSRTAASYLINAYISHGEFNRAETLLNELASRADQTEDQFFTRVMEILNSSDPESGQPGAGRRAAEGLGSSRGSRTSRKESVTLVWPSEDGGGR
ncbi:hypothetical protein L21SP2_3480 [Salinispira pacifica]|uniref:Transglutaminase-like domain-containing protein n=2 Tax=Salinispira pacifica TaxID=1307761 RepID=V5WNU4_9SPIO|nr:hypothetical protein L21SP2_3480 [Salinispira pacifica]